MDQNKIELAVVEQASDNAHGQELQLLTDLQLTFIGGGIGETTL